MAKLRNYEIFRKERVESLSTFSDESTVTKWFCVLDHKMAQNRNPEIASARQKMDSGAVLGNVGRGVICSSFH